MRIFAVKVCSPEKCHIHWTVVVVLQTRPFRDELPMSNSRFGLKADEDDVAKNEAPNAPDHEERAWKTQTAKMLQNPCTGICSDIIGIVSV
jgi:hypothetical protein